MNLIVFTAKAFDLTKLRNFGVQANRIFLLFDFSTQKLGSLTDISIGIPTIRKKQLSIHIFHDL